MAGLLAQSSISSTVQLDLTVYWKCTVPVYPYILAASSPLHENRGSLSAKQSREHPRTTLLLPSADTQRSTAENPLMKASYSAYATC
jgi:hypothetical protein